MSSASACAAPARRLLTVTEDGQGPPQPHRTITQRSTKRGGLGIRNYAKGDVAAVKIVDDTDDLILISANGILIRMHADDINIQSRYGGGVRVMRLAADDKVAMVARVDRDNGAVTEKPEEEGDAEPTAEELAAMEAQEAADAAADSAAPNDDDNGEE